MIEDKSKLFWQNGYCSRQQREQLQNHSAITIWLTGLSGSGKSTIAYLLEKTLITSKHACYVLDGDNLRLGINKDLGFSHSDRTENIRRVAEIAHLLNDAGLIVITAFISPYIADREMAREIIGLHSFKEIYLNTQLSVCEARDKKGLYKMARDGKIADFTGISAPYEVPKNPDLSIDTAETNVQVAVQEVIRLIQASWEQHTNLHS